MRVRYSFSSRRTRLIEGKNNHKQAFPKLAREVIRISDIVLEVLDARFIEETRNPEFEDLIRELGKKIIYVLNKADLVPVNELKDKIDSANLSPYVMVSCKTFMGKKNLRDRIKIEAKRLKQERKTHVGIIGYPNTGKSSLTNMLVGKKLAGTSAQSGFTKGIQKVKFAEGILLLDTPGVIDQGDSPATEKEDLNKTVKIGVKTYDKIKDPLIVVISLMKQNPGMLQSHYGIEAMDEEDFIQQLGRKRNIVKKHGLVDEDRTARIILKDWQSGKIKV